MTTYYQLSDACSTPSILNTQDISTLQSTGNYCVISAIDSSQISNTFDFSIGGLDLELTSVYFGGALFVWAIGLGIGLIVNVVRKAR